jgi:exodeoxyribonuclease VII large subunit
MHRVELETSRMNGMTKRLEALNPYQVLARGYAVITRQADDMLIRSVNDIGEGDGMRVRLGDGELEGKVTSKQGRRKGG